MTMSSSCPLRCYDDVSSSCMEPECVENCEFSCGLTCEFSKGKNKWGNDGGANVTGQSKVCPIATFRDVTALKLPKADSYWHQWFHSGRPYMHEGYQLLVDINHDGVLDYFNSMHAHVLNKSTGYEGRMELGESIPFDSTVDGLAIQEEQGEGLVYSAETTLHRFRRASYRIHIEDEASDVDPHGRNLLDLDGDGLDDILIASGGGMGQPLSPEYAPTRDNFLFWGESGVDDVTGGTTTIYRGGRTAARAAGVHMRRARGRTNYILDANGDGLLDIFMLSDRRGDNTLTPGVLLMNQGNRTWKPDDTFREFTRTMILTDADGDGAADELILHRGFCFPERQQPGSKVKDVFGPKMSDKTLEELGPFPSEVIGFCSSRPVGTTAVFKYGPGNGEMEEISTKYSNVSPDDSKQPPCCPHGAWETSNDCGARSMASGDLDGDLIADLVVLFQSKLFIYLSSDRPVGTLPTNPEFRSVDIRLPPTCDGMSVFVVDLDNNGDVELLVACDFVQGFLLYTQVGPSRDGRSWTLDNECNGDGAMGSLGDASIAGFSDEDYEASCDAPVSWKPTENACRYYKYKIGASEEHAEPQNPRLAGITLADFNNDGFLDIVLSYNLGYLRFLVNEMPKDLRNANHFIAFQLVGNPEKQVNQYGIGATLILTTHEVDGNGGGNSNDDDKDNNVIIKKQFREFNSYQHHTDHYAGKDDRIVFGLGTSMIPVTLTVRWPNKRGEIEEIDLSNWKFEPTLKPIVVKYGEPTTLGTSASSRLPLSSSPLDYTWLSLLVTALLVPLLLVICFATYRKRTIASRSTLHQGGFVTRPRSKRADIVADDELEALAGVGGEENAIQGHPEEIWNDEDDF